MVSLGLWRHRNPRRGNLHHSSLGLALKNLHRARGEPSGWVGQGTVIRVAIVADIRLYREGLARILERQPNISVVATAATSDGSLAPLSHLAPDLILIDVATVKNHVHNILEKLQVHRRGEAAARVRGGKPGDPGLLPHPPDR